MKRTIPLIYVIKAQRLYVNIFSWEDDDGIPCDEYRSYVHSKKAYDDYLDKMFLDDRETAIALDHLFNHIMFYPGTYKEICDFLRRRDYEVLSKDNSTREEYKLCIKKCISEWKNWKQLRKGLS